MAVLWPWYWAKTASQSIRRSLKRSNCIEFDSLDHHRLKIVLVKSEKEASIFDKYEKEAVRVIELGYVHPAYDYVLKCSHTFNLLDSRGAISVSERTAFISRVRNLARLCAQCYLKQREELGYPLLKKGAK